MKLFRCHVIILNTLDYLGKFNGKSNEGFFVGYSLNSKAFRVYNIRTKKVKENLHIRNKDDNGVNKDSGIDAYEKSANNINDVNTVGPSINTASTNFNTGSLNINIVSLTVSIASPKATHANFIGDKPEGDMSNINTTYQVLFTPYTRIHKDHSPDLVIGDVQSGVLTRKMTKTTHEQGFISTIYEEKTHKDLNTCLFACFLSQIEPTMVAKAPTDLAWVEAIHEELFQFKLQKVWILVDFPKGKKAIEPTRVSKALINPALAEAMQKELFQFKLQKVWILMDLPKDKKAIGTKWVFRNKKDEGGIVIKNKAILVAQAYASFMGFMVYQMDMKSASLYGRIEEEVYVCQPPGFEDPDHGRNSKHSINHIYGEV
nr:hypothetical protein [Tanacetum cinerariifolium]